MNSAELMKAIAIAMLEIQTNRITIKKIGSHWFLMLRTWNQLFIREFATHKYAVSSALWMIEVNGAMP